jgi:hypothetical protein
MQIAKITIDYYFIVRGHFYTKLFSANNRIGHRILGRKRIAGSYVVFFLSAKKNIFCSHRLVLGFFIHSEIN